MDRIDESRKRKACNVLTVKEKVDMTPTPIITFSESDMRLGLQPTDLEACAGKLYGFVTIKGIIELETTFEEHIHACTIPMLYAVVNVDASYNIIIGRTTLNKFGVVVSTLHLCMKYPLEQDEDLKEVSIGPKPTH
ncbi:hypothetical protein CR513_41341, partial [Mucuna pruriens]